MMANASWTSPVMGIDVYAHLPGKGTTAVWVREMGTFIIMLPGVVGLVNKMLFPELTALAEGQSLDPVTHIG